MLTLEDAPQLNGRALQFVHASELLKLADHDDDELTYHMMLIIDEGWIDGEYDRTSGKFILARLTADGHDFIDSTRKPDTQFLVYCGDYERAHSVVIDSECWPDHVRLSDLEPKFTCQNYGHRGADVRPNFQPARMGHG